LRRVRITRRLAERVCWRDACCDAGNSLGRWARSIRWQLRFWLRKRIGRPDQRVSTGGDLARRGVF